MAYEFGISVAMQIALFPIEMSVTLPAANAFGASESILPDQLGFHALALPQRGSTLASTIDEALAQAGDLLNDTARAPSDDVKASEGDGAAVPEKAPDLSVVVDAPGVIQQPPLQMPNAQADDFSEQQPVLDLQEHPASVATHPAHSTQTGAEWRLRHVISTDAERASKPEPSQTRVPKSAYFNDLPKVQGLEPPLLSGGGYLDKSAVAGKHHSALSQARPVAAGDEGLDRLFLPSPAKVEVGHAVAAAQVIIPKDAASLSGSSSEQEAVTSKMPEAALTPAKDQSETFDKLGSAQQTGPIKRELEAGLHVPNEAVQSRSALVEPLRSADVAAVKTDVASDRALAMPVTPAPQNAINPVLAELENELRDVLSPAPAAPIGQSQAGSSTEPLRILATMASASMPRSGEIGVRRSAVRPIDHAISSEPAQRRDDAVIRWNGGDSVERPVVGNDAEHNLAAGVQKSVPHAGIEGDTQRPPSVAPQPLETPSFTQHPQMHPDMGVKAHKAAVSAAVEPGPARPVLGQLVDAIKATASGGSEIQLSPQELGRVKIDLTTEGDVARLMISAEKADTQDLLRRHSDRLMGELRASGFTTVDLSFQSWGDSSAPWGEADMRRAAGQSDVGQGPAPPEPHLDPPDGESADLNPQNHPVAGLFIRM